MYIVHGIHTHILIVEIIMETLRVREFSIHGAHSDAMRLNEAQNSIDTIATQLFWHVNDVNRQVTRIDASKRAIYVYRRRHII